MEVSKIDISIVAARWKEKNKKDPEIKQRDDKGRILPSAPRNAEALGEEAIQYAKNYALEAERKMGEMLAATERNPGTRPNIEYGGHMTLPPSDVPTLAELGLTKRESSDALFSTKTGRL